MTEPARDHYLRCVDCLELGSACLYHREAWALGQGWPECDSCEGYFDPELGYPAKAPGDVGRCEACHLETARDR